MCSLWILAAIDLLPPDDRTYPGSVCVCVFRLLLWDSVCKICPLKCFSGRLDTKHKNFITACRIVF